MGFSDWVLGWVQHVGSKIYYLRIILMMLFLVRKILKSLVRDGCQSYIPRHQSFRLCYTFNIDTFFSILKVGLAQPSIVLTFICPKIISVPVPALERCGDLNVCTGQGLVRLTLVILSVSDLTHGQYQGWFQFQIPMVVNFFYI